MTFIVCEVGINHNGSLELAKRLIDAAKWAGADAVKFQKRTVEIVYDGQLDKPRESPFGNTVGDQKFALEFTRDEYDRIDDHCKAVGIPWFASCWDLVALDFIDYYDPPYHKVASAMATNDEFLAEVAKREKPIFASTGMCQLGDIRAMLRVLQQEPPVPPITLMHCVGTYPTEEKDLNLAMIHTLRKNFQMPVGYSGHEVSVSPSIMAAVLGATAIERHITLDRSMYGSDQAASLEPAGFKTMVDQIRKVPVCLGDGVKIVTEGERETAAKLRYWL